MCYGWRGSADIFGTGFAWLRCRGRPRGWSGWAARPPAWTLSPCWSDGIPCEFYTAC